MLSNNDDGPELPKPTTNNELEKVIHTARELAIELVRHDADPCRSLSSDEHRKHLDLRLQAESRDLDKVIDDLVRLLAVTPRTAGPLFFNQLFGGREPVAVLTEMLSPLVNSSMYTYKVAGPQILVEQEMINRLLQKAGFDNGEGMFTPGGSLSNFTAMLVARNEFCPKAREEGLDGQKLGIYASAESHYSITKNAGMLGLGRSSVRHIEVDSEGRMVPEALESAIVADEGRETKPVCIVATAGTTVRGAFDPIGEIADVAQRHGAWLHVDGAFGGTVLLSPKHRHLMKGCDRADSLAWNPHKAMGVPLTCSAVLLRKKGLLAKSLDESAEYLFQTATDELNPGRRSIQCGRRNDALKLWAAWRHLGDQGYARRIDRQFELANDAISIIEREPRLRLVHRPQFINICFLVVNGSAKDICDWLDRERGIRIGHGTLNDQVAFRLVCVNPDLTRADLESLFTAILEGADALAG
jgi:sulfinoalanine decarboxylase/sulfinoalanine decarboxylase/aspartate 1-decarboxylase